MHGFTIRIEDKTNNHSNFNNNSDNNDNNNNKNNNNNNNNNRFWRRLHLAGWRKDWKILETNMDSNKGKVKERRWAETERRIPGEVNKKQDISKTRWKQ